MIERAEGTDLIDDEGRRYIDGVSSLWCNVHGHRHPLIDQAVRDQLERVAHSTMLGLTHRAGRRAGRAAGRPRPAGAEPRLLLGLGLDGGRGGAEDGVPVLAPARRAARRAHVVREPSRRLPRRHAGGGLGRRNRAFHAAYSPLLFDAHRRRAGRRGALERVLDFHGEEVAAVIVEPLVQGAAGIRRAAAGYLRRVRELCDRHDVLLIGDEVATGFGRTGTMFACEQERRRARLPLPRQGPDRRLPAARRDADDRARLRGLPGRARGGPHLLPRPHVHGQPARLRGGAREPRRLRAREHAASPAAEDPPVGRAARARSRRCPRSPRSAAAASWSGSTWASTTRRSGSATGRPRGPERGAIVRPLGDVIVLMPPLSICRTS